MNSLSKQSKSFIVLFLIAVVGTFICVVIGKVTRFPGPEAAINTLRHSEYESISYKDTTQTNLSPQLPTDSTEIVDTSKWDTYTNPTYNFSFKYPASWKIKSPVTKNGFYTIEIDPGSKFYNAEIRMSTTGFFALDGLAHTAITIAGEQAIDIQGSLYGIKHNGVYYTFDQGMSETIKPQFEAMVKSLSFQ